MQALEQFMAEGRAALERTLERLLPEVEGPARTAIEAVRYAVLGGGKRLRPLLALAVCEAYGGESRVVLEPAAALELLHNYSLIHDDLPAMDDDALRRGRPTVHRVFGEAVAILAGDALQALAFEILATHPPGSRYDRWRAEAVRIVATRAGLAGLVGGQVADLEAQGRSAQSARLAWIHRCKSGALFAAAAEIGGLYAGADEVLRQRLGRFGEALGEAFQVRDDLLDETAEASVLGKTPGKDRRAGKCTAVAVYGREGSERRVHELLDEALAQLRSGGAVPALVEALARRAVMRAS